jgi:hypothetical protein
MYDVPISSINFVCTSALELRLDRVWRSSIGNWPIVDFPFSQIWLNSNPFCPNLFLCDRSPNWLHLCPKVWSDLTQYWVYRIRTSMNTPKVWYNRASTHMHHCFYGAFRHSNWAPNMFRTPLALIYVQNWGS